MEELLIPLAAFFLLARSGKGAAKATAVPPPVHDYASAQVSNDLVIGSGGVPVSASLDTLRPGVGVDRPAPRPKPYMVPLPAEAIDGANAQAMTALWREVKRLGLPSSVEWAQTGYYAAHPEVENRAYRSVGLLWYCASCLARALVVHAPGGLRPIDGKIQMCPPGTSMAWWLAPMLHGWAHTRIPKSLASTGLDGPPPWDIEDPLFYEFSGDPLPISEPMRMTDDAPRRQMMTAMKTAERVDDPVPSLGTPTLYYSFAWIMRELESAGIGSGGFAPDAAPVVCMRGGNTPDAVLPSAYFSRPPV